MNHVAVTCPECGRSRVVNGRGRCRCGAYMVVQAGSSFVIGDPPHTYFWRNGRWVSTAEHRETK